MKSLSMSVLIAGFLALAAGSLEAQVPGFDIRLNPRIGVYTPLTSLAEIDDAGQRLAADLEGRLALGLGVELDLAVLPFGLRANLDYVDGSKVTVSDGGVDRETGVETTLLAVVGDVIFRPLPRLLVFSPYLFAGGGLKQYDFSFSDSSVEAFQNESDPTGHLGLGLDLAFGPLDLNAEVGDYISWFDMEGTDSSEMQHDVFATIGFSIGLL